MNRYFRSPLRSPVLGLILSVGLVLLVQSVASQDKPVKKDWVSHAQVARDVIKKFNSFTTYTADFSVLTVDGSRRSNMAGKFYYKRAPGDEGKDSRKPAKVLFKFDNGNFIVSDGKLMYIYLRRLNAVGKQDLTLKKKNESNREIFSSAGPGLARLFNRKYHYHFDTQDQPRVVDGATVYVLKLEQREKIGGYETIILHVDASSYLIRKAVASDGYGKETTITFTNPRLDVPLEGTLFQFEPKSGMTVVPNPLVNETPTIKPES